MGLIEGCEMMNISILFCFDMKNIYFKFAYNAD
ncbi:hypothetical protein SAMN05216273_101130 [Chryseobacterium taihuense]|uniref:Uncharacterized protein n=1 Tax=Chryseobacterium taihuense TaxID=1141221 RepID=A0ABY0QPF4_9FLAO|nr:hypothetical protein SAMN05216273_101130 [Chryseobacterium taihuense]